MKIGVIGTGYVGLVQGVILAQFGLKVICVDNNKEKIDRLNNGEVPIYEPELEDLLVKNIKEKSEINDYIQSKKVGDKLKIKVKNNPL